MVRSRSIVVFLSIVILLLTSHAGAFVVRVETPCDVVSDTVCMLTITLERVSIKTWPTQALRLEFYDAVSGNIWFDSHFPPRHAFDSLISANATADDLLEWDVTYTIPVWPPSSPPTNHLPLTTSHSPLATNHYYKITAVSGELVFPNVGQLHAAERSIFRRAVQPVFESGWTGRIPIKPEHLSGFYELECPSGQTDCWRWMSGIGRITFANPRMPLVLHFEGWIPENHQAGRLRIRVNDNELAILSPSDERFNLTCEVPLESLGENDQVVVTLEADATFRPADDGKSTDTRELGVMVKTLRLDVSSDPTLVLTLLDVIRALPDSLQWWRLDETNRLTFKNPGKNVRLFLKCRIPEQDASRTYHVKLNDSVIDTFIPNGNEFTLLYEIPITTISGAAEIVFNITTDSPGPFPSLIVTRLWIE